MPYSPPLMPIITRPFTTRGACDGEGLTLIAGDHAPDRLAAARIQRNQPAVNRTDVDLSLPGRYATIDDVAAGFDSVFTRDFGVVRPEEFSTGRVVRLHHAPGGRHVHHTVDHQRGGLLSAIGIKVGVPREA